MLSRAFVSLFMVAFIVLGCSKDDKDESKFLESFGEPEESVSDEVLEKGRQVQAMGWQEPAFTATESTDVLKIYSHVDTKKIVPRNLLKNALLYYHQNYALLKNKDVITIVDFSKHSRKPRFYIVNMRTFGVTGDVEDYHISHGVGSDRKHTGYASVFSNVRNSEMSSLGFYVTGETYTGKHGYSRRLDGLSKTNSMVRARAIVLHGASYVYDAEVRQGRSQGCIAFSMKNRTRVIDTLVEGTLIYVGRSRYD